jgi:16S rRNA (guanine527-N7)-methyltransferase
LEPWESTLADTAASWGIALSDAQLAQFRLYADELRRWNERVNLTAISDPAQIAVRHFLDSLRCALLWGEAPQSLIDIGTGAGFPGLPLKLLRPSLALTLVESVAKKAAFLEHVVAQLGLNDVTVVVGRAEALGRDPLHRERYDVATARAVAELRVLAEYCLPLCRVGGRFLAPKSERLSEELAQAERAIGLLGGALLEVAPVALPGVEPRTIAVVEKVAPTPPAYPRAVGVPARRPL